MKFPVGSFTNIDNLRKMCYLENFCKNPQENWQIFPIYQVKSTRKFLHTLQAFHNFYFVYFHWKATWHLGKINKKVKTERVNNWTESQSSCLGSRVPTFPLVYSPKQPISYCCRIYTILSMIFKKRLFIEALCRALFTRYAPCKPLFPFQNNA